MVTVWSVYKHEAVHTGQLYTTWHLFRTGQLYTIWQLFKAGLLRKTHTFHTFPLALTNT